MRMMILAAASLLFIAGPAFSFDIEQRGHLATAWRRSPGR
jgi:hypothetical protein